MIALRLDNVVKNFGGIHAVNGISLEIEMGERRAILGPNGAGKTTLFNLISGIFPPTEGGMFLFDREVTTFSAYRRAELGLSRTFQITDLFFRLSLFENIMLSVQARDKCKFALHRRVKRYRNLMNRVESYLDRWKLTDKRNELVANLSYGEQRKLEIIMALATNPRILLLDEPTAGLSSADTMEMTGFLKDLDTEITILLIEHDMDVAFDLANHITVMHYGRIIADGKPDEVKGDPAVLEIYFGEDEG